MFSKEIIVQFPPNRYCWNNGTANILIMNDHNNNDSSLLVSDFVLPSQESGKLM